MLALKFAPALFIFVQVLPFSYLLVTHNIAQYDFTTFVH